MKTNLLKALFSRSTFGMLCATIAIAATPLVRAQDPPAKAPAPATVKVDPIVAELVEAHNKERAKEGLPPLKLESKLQEAARVHAKDMADHEMMSHEGSDGSSPSQRVLKAGYHYILTGENVARGYRDVESVMQVWMDSPPHKKNIMGEYTEIGAAMVLGDDGKTYWATEFGKPMPSFDPATAAADLVKKINEERIKAKLPALAIDTRLAKAAEDQAANLAKKKSQGGGTASFDGIDQKLYQDLALSTAAGHPDAETMTKVVMANSDLKAQILGKFARIGTGYATSEGGIPYWCLILANPARSTIEGKPKLNNR